MLNSNEHETGPGLFDLTPNPVLFPSHKHPVDYYMVFEPSTHADLILSNPSIVGVISYLEGKLTKNVLTERIVNFEDNIRTIVSVSGSATKTRLRKHWRKSS